MIRPDGRQLAHWTGLAAASAAIVWMLAQVHVPAALLLGPMLAGIAFATQGSPVRVSRPAFLGAQAVVGCLIAKSITAAIVVSVAQDWPAMLLVVLSTIASAAAVGWLLGRFGTLPGSEAAWGSSPGGASAMVGMAEEYGADPRIVAFMQYARVVCVVLTSALVARFAFGPVATSPVPGAAPSGLLAGDLPSLAGTLAVGVAGSWIGHRLRVPAGALLGPMLIGAVLHATGLLEIALPEPVLALSYAVLGWYVGLRFTRPLLRVIWRAVPEVLLACLATILLSALSAWLLTRLRHTDPLTAYLATSPGGIDSVAVIALGTGADVGFVMALQVLRVVLVLLAGPPLAKLVARSSRRA